MADKSPLKKQKAKSLLQEWLADGPKEVDELKQRAEAAGIGWRTIVKVKNEIGVVSQKPKGKLVGDWTWLLPEDA